MFSKEFLYISNPIEGGDLYLDILHVVGFIWISDYLELEVQFFSLLNEVPVGDV